MTFAGKDFNVQHVVRGALSRDVQPVGVDVGRVGVLHRVPLAAGVRPLQRVGNRELVGVAGVHADRRSRDLLRRQ